MRGIFPASEPDWLPFHKGKRDWAGDVGPWPSISAGAGEGVIATAAAPRRVSVSRSVSLLERLFADGEGTELKGVAVAVSVTNRPACFGLHGARHFVVRARATGVKHAWMEWNGMELDDGACASWNSCRLVKGHHYDVMVVPSRFIQK